MSEVARSPRFSGRTGGRRDGGTKTPAETTMMKANSDERAATVGRTDGKNLAEDSHHFSRYRLFPDMEADGRI